MPLQNEDSPHLGKIAGPMLGKRLQEGVDNLARDGVDLAFETDLLYLDVNSNKIGIRDVSPSKEFRIQGKFYTTNLIVDTKLSNDDLEIRSDGSITTPSSSLYLNAANYIASSNIRTDDVDFDNNVISTLSSNRKLELRPTGNLDIYNNLNITGDLYATGDIVLEGNVIFGNNDNDSIGLLADVNSNILPDLTNTYSLGRNGRRWSELRTELVNGNQLQSGGLFIGDLDIVLRQGNIWYVAQNGSDTNEGDHQNGPFRTIKHALSQATSGDTVYIYPGEYEEDLPLVVPVGVTVNGVDIRNVIIQPDTDTQSQDVFLLNGETTVSNLTIRNFYYDSVNDTGYAFRFAPNFKVTTRSPYIQNITVKTKGSLTTVSDPRGFDSGDAGRGALIDGGASLPDTKEASMLFHSCTFITPGADAIVMTNGVRVEWLNSFTYFANRGLYAIRGAGRLTDDGSTLRYGAEIRSIGSANVYGNFGVVADGEDTLMYLVNHNFGYIGTGKDENNDPSLRIQANETVELGLGKIYYQSMDHEGDFRVGDVFNIDAQTGFISINGFTTSGENSSIVFGGLTGETRIDATEVTTGNIRFRQNILSSLSGDVTLKSGTGVLNFIQDVNVYKNLDIVGDTNIEGRLTIGNQNFDIAEFAADIEFDLRPHIDNEYILGNESKQWNTVFLRSSAFVDSNIELTANEIKTISSNIDLNVTANGTGRIYVPTNNVEIDNNLTVNVDTITTNIDILGSTVHTGNKQQLGSTEIVGNINLTGNLTVNGNAFYQNINLLGNLLTTSDSNSDLELTAAATGRIYTAETDVEIDTELTVNQNITAGEVINQGLVTADILTNNIFSIYDNKITTVTTNTDIKFGASVSGRIYVPTNNVEINNNLTINVDTDVDSVNILGNLNQTGNKQQLGSTEIVGNINLTGNLTVNGNAFYQNINLLGNLLTTSDSNSDLELTASGTGIVYIPNNSVEIDTELTVNQNITAGEVINQGLVTADILTNNIFSIYDNKITTVTTNTDIELEANGTGRIYVPTNNVEINNNLTVNVDTDVDSVNILGNLNQTGSTTRLGNTALSGSAEISQTLIVGEAAYFNEITFLNNKIFTNSSNSDLELISSGSGAIVFLKPTQINENLSIQDTTYTSNIVNSQTVVSEQFLNNNISIIDNNITTVSPNVNLILSAAGSGTVNFQNNNVKINQKLTVSGLTTVLNTNITGLINHTGNSLRTGALTLTGNMSVTNLTVTNGIQFEDIDFDNNVITTTLANNDLQLEANGTGQIYVPTNNVEIDNNLTVNSVLYTENINNSQVVSSDKFLSNKIEVKDNYIETTSNDNLVFLASNNVVVEDVTFDGNRIRTNTLNSKLVITPGTDKNLILNSNKSLLLARGTSTNRPTLELGDLRFNSVDNLFEGFSTARRTIGGVYSANRNSFINLNSLTNSIAFTIGLAPIVDINETRLRANELRIDNLISLNNNVIANTAGTDLFLTPSGTGSVIAGSLGFIDNDISNNSLTDRIIFTSTADGYLKFSGVNGLVIPVGTTAEQPINPDLGDIRYNTEDEQVEVYNGSQYTSITGTGELVNEEDVRELGDLWSLVLG